MSRLCVLCLVIGIAVALTPSSSGQARDEMVFVTSYDIKDLVGKKASFRLPGEKPVNVTGIDSITGLIVTAVDSKSWRDKRFFIREVDGERLEIQTTKTNHEMIASLLEALRIQMDVTVEVETELYEVDQALYQKKFAPAFAKNHSFPLALDQMEENAFRKAARRVRANKVTLDDGEKGRAFSLRRAIPYEGLPQQGEGKTAKVAFVGVRLDTQAQVSPDRRYVHVKLTQSGAELIGMHKQPTIDNQGNEIELAIPSVRESSTTTSITVGDSVSILIPLLVSPPGVDARGRVHLFLVTPRALIGEEERFKKFGPPAAHK